MIVNDGRHDKDVLHFRDKWNELTTFLEENRQHIFYLLLFFSINVWLFVERFIRNA